MQRQSISFLKLQVIFKVKYLEVQEKQEGILLIMVLIALPFLAVLNKLSMSIKLKIKPFVNNTKEEYKQLPLTQKKISINTPPVSSTTIDPHLLVADSGNAMMEQMQKIFKYSINLGSKQKQSGQSGLQCRDRVIHSLSKFAQEQIKDDQRIQQWIGEVCRNVVSTTFHYYLNENMTFKQAKVYCCQQILRNISQFAQKNQVNQSFFKRIDEIMTEKVLPYLALKYPLSQSFNANRALNRVVKQINNMEVLSNDFFYNSDIALRYRQNGNYNDIIMRVLNQIISLADRQTHLGTSSQEDNQQITNFKDFDDYITKFFEKIYDPEWMAHKSKFENRDTSKDHIMGMPSLATMEYTKNLDQVEKYKEKVQQYTEYDIGRKIPENVACFTEEEIRSGQLIIKSPQILRIMAKWCEQLWTKFQNENYYIDKAEGITSLNSKQINILYEWIKIALKKLLKDQKAKIQKYMSSVETNLYEQQYKILQSQLLSKQAPFLNRYQRVCGKFSTKVVNNLKNCVVVYLNRLIHGLMFVSDTLYKTKMKGMPSWPSAPNLLSFKVGDLLRCRISSNQRQIVRLYQQLTRRSQKNPDKIKIIRVKNRLKNGTNDLLINVRFNCELIAQIQLKVRPKNTQSRFQICSYKFSHFIYELQRSQFGPISQLCNIWAYHDLRNKIYQQLVNKQNLNANMTQLQYTCLVFGSEHQSESISNQPFICSKCGKSYSSDNYVLSHKKCKICSYYKCCLCQINSRQNKDLMDELVHDENIRQNLFSQRCQILPKLGVYIKIQSTEGQMNMFKVIQARQKNYLFIVRADGSFDMKFQLKTEKERKKFLRDYMVYEYCGQQPQAFKELTFKKALVSYIQPLYIRNCYKYERQALSLNQVSGMSFDPSLFGKLLSSPSQSKKAVKQLEVSNHNLTNLDFIPSDLVNLELINVNFNQLTTIDALAKFRKLKIIYCLSNSLTTFPSVLCKLPLKVLSIGQNKIKKLPNEIQNLKSLEIIRFDNNGMQEFPIVLTKLYNMKQIYANSNQLKTIPPQIGHLTRLRLLKLQYNQINKLPKQMESLTHLQLLELSNNNLNKLEVNFKSMKRLKELYLRKNKFTQIPKEINQSRQLSKLALQENSIPKINFSAIILLNIQQIRLENCKIREIESLKSLSSSLISLKLSNNQLTSLNNDICELKYLKVLDLERNKLKNLPRNIYQLYNLQHLNLSNNDKIDLPQTFSKLKLFSLSLSKCHLYQVPKIITDLKFLRELDISSNHIRLLPKQIKDLKYLQIFMFGNNLLTKIPDQLVELKKIKKISFRQKGTFSINNILIVFFKMQSPSLDLSKCQIENLPQQISLNTDLQNLNMNSNSIRTLPGSIMNLISLKDLNISKNKLSFLNQAVFELKQLVSLNVSHNNLTDIPNKFNKLRNLTSLDISYNKLTQIPDSLQSIFRRDFRLNYIQNNISRTPSWMITKDFTSTSLLLSNANLQKLPRILSSQAYKTKELSKNKFQQFPAQILNLTKTEQLNLSYNQIKLIPKGIRRLANLKNLYISYNLIEEIPSQLCSLLLQKLQIDHNPLKKVAQNMSKLTKLHLRISPSVLFDLKANECIHHVRPNILMLDKLELSTLPPELGQIAFVKQLNLSYNLLKIMPECILNLRQLTIINLSYQPLQTLADQIHQLINLSELIATNCRLQVIPSSIGKLSKLFRINLSNNQIETLPLEMKKLSNLNRLQINNNNLTQIPDFIWNLPKCAKVYLSGNKITNIPEKIVHSVVRQLSLSYNQIQIVPSFMEKVKLCQGYLMLQGNPIKQVYNYQKIRDKFSVETIKQLQKFNPNKKMH